MYFHVLWRMGMAACMAAWRWHIGHEHEDGRKIVGPHGMHTPAGKLIDFEIDRLIITLLYYCHVVGGRFCTGGHRALEWHPLYMHPSGPDIRMEASMA